MAKGGGRPKVGRTTAPPGRGIRLTRRQRRRLVGVLAAAAAVGVAGTGWWYAQSRGMPGTYVPSLGNAHVPGPDTPHQPYNSDPPTSGPHVPWIAPWGVHSRPIPREVQVHNLEDGGVAVQYRPECADRVAEPLRRIVERYPDHVLLAPYPGLTRCIALTAWTRIDTFDEVDEARIVRFIDAYRGIDHHTR